MGKSGAVGQRQIAKAIDGIPCHALEDTASRIDVPGCSSSSIEMPEQSRTATSLTPLQDGGWTAEKLATLRQLWQAGLSARQIARKLPGFNRHAITNKALRIGLVSRPSSTTWSPWPVNAPARPGTEVQSETLVQHATKHMPEVRALAADLTAGMMVCTVDTAESVSSAEPCHLEQSDEADQAVTARQMPDPATLQLSGGPEQSGKTDQLEASAQADCAQDLTASTGALVSSTGEPAQAVEQSGAPALPQKPAMSKPLEASAKSRMDLGRKLVLNRKGITMAELSEGTCRWPLGDPTHPDFHFCGAEKNNGSSYCAEHHARAFVKTRSR